MKTTTYNAKLSSIQNMLEFFGEFSGVPHETHEQVVGPKKLKLESNSDSEILTDGSLRVKVPTVSPSQYKFINWEAVSNEKLSMVEYHRYAKFLDWKIASGNIDIEITPLFSEYIDWPVFVATHPVGLKELRNIGTPLHTIKARLILESQPLTQEELEKYEHILDMSDHDPIPLWHVICKTQFMSETFIEKNADKLDWEQLITYQLHLSKQFLKKHRHRFSREYLDIFTFLEKEVVEYIYA